MAYLAKAIQCWAIRRNAIYTMQSNTSYNGRSQSSLRLHSWLRAHPVNINKPVLKPVSEVLNSPEATDTKSYVLTVQQPYQYWNLTIIIMILILMKSTIMMLNWREMIAVGLHNVSLNVNKEERPKAVVFIGVWPSWSTLATNEH